MQDFGQDNFFINTIKPRHLECPSSAVIFGSNGSIGHLLGRSLQSKGCDVSFFAKAADPYITEESFFKGSLESIFDEEHKDVFQRDAVLYLPFYELEPLDMAFEELEIVHKLRERALHAGFSRIVLVTALEPPEATEGSANIDRLRHILNKDKHLPVSHFRSSLIMGRETALWRAMREIQPPIIILPREARGQECTPIHIDDLVSYLSEAHDAALPRDYDFEVGGPDVVSFKRVVEHSIAELGLSARVTYGVGITELFSQFTFNRARRTSGILDSFIERTKFSMRADTNKIRKYYADIESKRLFNDENAVE